MSDDNTTATLDINFVKGVIGKLRQQMQLPEPIVPWAVKPALGSDGHLYHLVVVSPHTPNFPDTWKSVTFRDGQLVAYTPPFYCEPGCGHIHTAYVKDSYLPSV